MKIVPLADKVVIKRLEAAEKSAGGILLPEAVRDQPQQGKVLCVGLGKLLPDGKRRPLQVSEGDRVVFSAWSGVTVQVEDEELLVLGEADILAVVENSR